MKLVIAAMSMARGQPGMLRLLSSGHRKGAATARARSMASASVLMLGREWRENGALGMSREGLSLPVWPSPTPSYSSGRSPCSDSIEVSGAKGMALQLFQYVLLIWNVTAPMVLAGGHFARDFRTR